MECSIRNNDLLKNVNTNTIERILWIDFTKEYCYCIQISTKKLKINIRTLESIERGFEQGIYTILKDDDTYRILYEDKLNPKRKIELERRYCIVNEIDNNENIPFCFIREYRGKFVKKVINKYKITEKTVYHYLRKYWQGGRTKEALMDKYDNCGTIKNKKYKGKTGRKSIAVKLTNKPDGIIINDEVKKIFKIGVNRYYKNNPQMTLTRTLKEIIADSYLDKHWYEKPTYKQFYYWFRNNVSKEEMEKTRNGEKNYQNNLRGLNSDSVYESFEPGFRYQVDSTIFPIYLVNRINRNLNVGRPIVYFSVDVFSTMVTGIHVGLHNESWEGYSSLMYNTFEEKKKYCKEFGINISNDDWDVYGLPNVIMGDRGGFISKNSDMLAKNLQVATEYAPSYIGSAKGTVEKKFDIIEKMIKTDLPGIIMNKYRERGQKDYRKGAKLDIFEFTQIVLEAVLQRNSKFMENYPLEKELVLDGVSPCAKAIWNWGIKNKKGTLSKQPENKIRFYLLRHAKASITEKGIKYKKMFYTCNLAETQNWFSRIEKHKKVEIAFDSRCMNVIFFYNDLTKTYIQFEINRQLTANDVYINRTLEEIENYDNDVLIKGKTIYNDKNDELFVKSRKYRHDVVSGAKKKSEGNRVKVNDIKKNRSVERTAYDEQQSLVRNPYEKDKNIQDDVIKQKYECNKTEDEAIFENCEINSRKTLTELIKNKILSENK